MAHSRAASRSTAAFLILLTLLAASGVAAQGLSVTGRVVGPDGAPVPGQTVVLHRVTADGGTLLGEATSDRDGRFLVAAAGPVPDSAVFFVATRYEGRLYLGPLIRAPVTDEEITLEVGDPSQALDLSTVAPPPTTIPGSAAGTPRRWFLLLIPAGGLVALAVVAMARASGPSAERRLLIRLAALDNRHADAGGAGDGAEYETRRRRLLDELDAIG